MLRQNRHPRDGAQPSRVAAPGIFVGVSVGFPSRRLPAAPPVATLHRINRLLSWGAGLVRAGLIDDPCFVAALDDFEAATLSYLDTLP